jgi:type II secretory pathway pseudopilin PulG
MELPNRHELAIVPKDHVDDWAMVVRGERPSLQDSDKLPQLQEALASTPGGRWRGVIRLDSPVVQPHLTGLPVDPSGLRAAGWAMDGHGSTHLWVEAERPTVKAIEALYRAWLMGVQAEIDAMGKRLNNASTVDGLGIIIAKHGFAGAQKTIAPRFTDGRIEVQLTLSEDVGFAVVPIVGILAAVAVPAFMKYTHDAQTAEARENVKSLADGALSTAQRHDGEALRFPLAGERVCTAPWDPHGDQIELDATPPEVWETFAKELSFELSKKHYYQYCYSASADGSRFEVTAEMSMSTAQVDSRFVVEGWIEDGRPVFSSLREEL